MIAIKNMEMPSCCAKCKLCEYNECIGYYCTANSGGNFTMTRDGMKEKRLDNCPLVERPTENVVERENLDKAIKELDNFAYHLNDDEACAVDKCIEILKKIWYNN